MTSTPPPVDESELRIGIRPGQIATSIILLALLAALVVAAFSNADARDRETAFLAQVERTSGNLLGVQRQASALSQSVDEWVAGSLSETGLRNALAQTKAAVDTVTKTDPDALPLLSGKFNESLQVLEGAAAGEQTKLEAMAARSAMLIAARSWLNAYQSQAVTALRELSSVRATNERNQGALLLLTLALSATLLTWVGISVGNAYRRARRLIGDEEAKVSSARSALEHATDQLAFQASHDALTGLPNRTALVDRISAELNTPNEHPLTVLFCDLDDFKVVNDSLGHAFGDDILAEAGARIKRTVGDEGFVGRFGGDEFVAVCPGLADVAAAERVADRISRAISKPLDIGGFGAVIGVAVGIARSRLDSTANQLLREADVAMYRAKANANSGQHVELFDETSDPYSQRFDTEMALRRAVSDQQLLLHWQPIVNLRNSQVHTLEALVRWQRPGSGLLRPADFMDIAEDSGLIVDIGRWVIATACTAGALTEERRVSVNVSARQLRHVNFVDDLLEILATTKLPPERLILEVTEQTVIDPAVVDAPLRRVRELGVKVAIDDFGTGYSSLSLLHRLPVDIVKLDRSFVRDIVTTPANQAIIKSLVQLTNALNMQFVVEGVESDAQRKLLRGLGVQHGQGFWFGQPEPGRLFRARA